MARLFPPQNPAEIDNDGERAMAQALVRQLPDRVEIFHSIDVLDRKSDGALREMECDFILLDPKRGMLFVEVKGGPIRLEEGRWRRNGKDIKDPFRQAKGNMHAIVKKLRESTPIYKNGVPFTFGFAVAFPDCRYSGALPPNVTHELLLDSSRLDDLAKAVNDCFKAWQRPRHLPMHDLEVLRIRRVLYPGWAVMPIPGRQIEKQEERLVRLTNEQKKILEFLSGHSKAAIQGLAGSGKTLLALDKALEMAHAGYRTALLCFNRQLQYWLQLSLPPGVHGENLVINTHWDLTAELCAATGVSVPYIPDDVQAIDDCEDEQEYQAGLKDGQEFWFSDKAPQALRDACEKLGAEHKFDAVIVDEGQEFDDHWWRSLVSLFRDPDDKACFYVFYDPEQSLYIKCRHYLESAVSGQAPAPLPAPPEELGPPYILKQNCRNTRRIAKHCAKLAGCESQQRDGAPEGVEPEEIPVESPLAAFREAARIVRRWCAPEGDGLEMSQVALLSPDDSTLPHHELSLSLDYSWNEEPNNPRLTFNLEEWVRNEGILHTSLFAFKGVEADAVIVIESPPPFLHILDLFYPRGWVGPFKIDMPPLGAGYYGELDKLQRYVAYSRAKHRLTIIRALNPAPIMSEESHRKLKEAGYFVKLAEQLFGHDATKRDIELTEIICVGPGESDYSDVLEKLLDGGKATMGEDEYRRFEATINQFKGLYPSKDKGEPPVGDE